MAKRTVQIDPGMRARTARHDRYDFYNWAKIMNNIQPQPHSGPAECSAPHWRFEDLEIWQLAADLGVSFHAVASLLDERKLYRYAEQLRAAGLSVSNNIAEGSASPHVQEFLQFLNIARRSLFEDASMLLVFQRMGLLHGDETRPLLIAADTLSRKITNFSKSLRGEKK
jgi:four helix bundle protein